VVGFAAVTGWASPWHIAIFAVVVLLLFGAKRLPEIGRSLGTGMREFKRSISDHHEQADSQEITTAAASELPSSTAAGSDRRERDAI
jgi:sec-independent protein translocase protein TatA